MTVWRSRSFLLVVGGLVVMLALAAGVFAYDRSGADRIADGIAIGGIDVGGLDAAAARERVRTDVAARLRRDVVARYRGVELTLTARRARVAVDVDGSVRQALARSRDGTLVGRVARRLTGGAADVALDPEVRFDAAGVDRLVRRAQARLDRSPRDAAVEFRDGVLRVATAQGGRRVQAGRLRRDLERTLASPAAHTVEIAVDRTAPAAGTAALAKRYPTLLAVDRARFQLTLYKDLRVRKRYTVAIGQVGLDTPAGEYEIQNKAVDPTWNVPNSAWAGDQAGQVIPPGPSNPLKARWMGIFDGAGIHGTDATYSLGTAASHGCVRMAIPDVIELYDQVPVGTPIFIG